MEFALIAAACLLVGGAVGYAGAFWRYALKPYFEELAAERRTGPRH